MATRLKKIMQPILKQKCSEAFKAGFAEGLKSGWDNRLRVYTNRIEFLKLMVHTLIEKKWIPVEELMPETKTKVLVFGGAEPIWVKGVKKPMPSIYTGYTRGEDEGWFTWDDSKGISNVTHWMPLPDPPKEVER